MRLINFLSTAASPPKADIRLALAVRSATDPKQPVVDHAATPHVGRLRERREAAVHSMGGAMIELLDHNSESVAEQIYDVFQLSFKVEARLVGVKNFPPLRRNASHIRSSVSQFLGQRIGVDLAAVVEFTRNGENLSIDSLVVHSQYFRCGLASQLLRSLLAKVHWQIAAVETAAANKPALVLYQKFGFSESKRWKTADGIEKVQLMCSKTIEPRLALTAIGRYQRVNFSVYRQS